MSFFLFTFFGKRIKKYSVPKLLLRPMTIKELRNCKIEAFYMGLSGLL